MSSTRPAHLSLNKLVISAVSSAQVVPRLTFRQLGSVAISADALSPLGRVRAKPDLGAYLIVDAVSTVKTNPAVCIYPLQYVNVTVAGCDCVALEDSGCRLFS